MRIQTDIERKHLRAIVKLASTDERRYVLNGVRCEFGEHGIFLVATDGRKLGVLHANSNPFPQTAFTLPHTIVEMVARGNTERLPVEISDEDGLLVKLFLDQGVLECTKENEALIDGNYPNWRHVIPSGPICSVPHAKVRFDYLDAFHELAAELSAGVSPIMQFTGVGNPITIQFEELPEFLGVVMPMRGDFDPNPIPNWMRRAIALTA